MDEEKETAEQEVREVARGRRWYTPFMVVGGIAAVAWGVAGLITAILILVWLLR